jgi:hypothetical protein
MKGTIAFLCIARRPDVPGGCSRQPPSRPHHRQRRLRGARGGTGHGACLDAPEDLFNNTTEPVTTTNPHPLHVHVHRAEHGTNLDIVVLGSPADDCDGYLNYEP